MDASQNTDVQGKKQKVHAVEYDLHKIPENDNSSLGTKSRCRVAWGGGREEWGERGCTKACGDYLDCGDR